MNKRSWWKAAAAVSVLGVGVAFADSPKVENAVWSRASTPVVSPTVAPAASPVVQASAVVPVVKPEVKPALPVTPNYPLPPKSSSDSVVLPEFKKPAQPVVPVVSLPPITMPPAAPAREPAIGSPSIPKIEGAPPAAPAREPAIGSPSIPKIEVAPPAAPVPPSIPKIEGAPPSLPVLPELAPPAQPAKSVEPVKPVPPAIPDFNLRPAPGGNSVNSNGPLPPAIPAIPVAQPEPPGVAKAPIVATVVSRPKPQDDPIDRTEKFVFPIPVKVAKAPPPIPATLPRIDMPEGPAVPPKPLPKVPPPDVVPVPSLLPGVPTSIEKPKKPELTTIPTPGADPMTLKQSTMAAALGTALALFPAQTAFAQNKTTDEKLADAQKEIKRLGELLEGRKDTDGKPSPVDVGAVEELKRLKDDVFRLKEKVNSLQTQLDEMKKSTSLKPTPPADPMAGKGTVRIENDYPIEITIVLNAMSYRVPANTKLDVPVPVGDFTYQLLNSGTSLAPVKSPIKEKEIVKLRIK